MKPVRTLVALLLAVVWPLAASHCALENLPSLSFLGCETGGGCGAQPEANAHSDACTVVESGCYKTENGRLNIPVPPAHCFCARELPPENSDAFAVRHILPETSPPGLAPFWQFFFRAARPPRAPSFVS